LQNNVRAGFKPAPTNKHFMKKIITFFAIVALAVPAFPLITLHGGGNISQLTGRYLEYSVFGGQIGVTTFSSRLFSVQPGAFLISKGGQNAAGQRTRLNYLEIPVNATLGFSLSRIRLSVGAGVYGSFGLWGRTPGGGSIDFFSDQNPHRFFDFGWQVVANGHWGRYGARLSLSRGFISAVNVSSRPHNYTFSFGLSYTLGAMQ